ncbi:MAG: hypothetical protein E6F98_01200 [Actinobacteria bacterium]|nr:MAG: hypothetical protein E6F98_01200 [Actinomycetota bacterium]
MRSSRSRSTSKRRSESSLSTPFILVPPADRASVRRRRPRRARAAPRPAGRRRRRGGRRRRARARSPPAPVAHR